MSEKVVLRGLYKKKLGDLSLERREEASSSLLRHFENLKLPTLSFYNTLLEIDLLPLNRLLARKGILFLPKIIDNDLLMFRVENIEEQTQMHLFGFREPIPERCERGKEVSHILVPGLCFDQKGKRLGYGKGYYDRFLKGLSQVRSIGIGFKEQYAFYVPYYLHDVTLKETFLF